MSPGVNRVQSLGCVGVVIIGLRLAGMYRAWLVKISLDMALWGYSRTRWHLIKTQTQQSFLYTGFPWFDSLEEYDLRMAGLPFKDLVCEPFWFEDSRQDLYL